MSNTAKSFPTTSSRRSHAAYIYPVQRQELVKVKIAFALRWQVRRSVLRDLRFYCQFVGFDYRFNSEGGWLESRHILTAEGSEAQIEDLVAYALRRFQQEGAVEVA
jgi:hypothetical protein